MLLSIAIQERTESWKSWLYRQMQKQARIWEVRVCLSTTLTQEMKIFCFAHWTWSGYVGGEGKEL